MFEGEDGIDEGGVQKEFMQVVTRELLDPAYAMFKEDDETNQLFFNPHTFEIGRCGGARCVVLSLATRITNPFTTPFTTLRTVFAHPPTHALTMSSQRLPACPRAHEPTYSTNLTHPTPRDSTPHDSALPGLEFELIGLLVGVAIYNSIILDFPFPMVIYKQLKGKKPTLEDLIEAQPQVSGWGGYTATTSYDFLRLPTTLPTTFHVPSCLLLVHRRSECTPRRMLPLSLLLPPCPRRHAPRPV